jgi:hypothetical protein
VLFDDRVTFALDFDLVLKGIWEVFFLAVNSTAADLRFRRDFRQVDEL